MIDSNEHEIKIEDVLSSLRDTIASQAQEIAVLKATVKSLSAQNAENKSK